MNNTAEQTTGLKVDTWCINNFKGNSDFDAMRWVNMARSKDTLRQNICRIFVDGGLVVATDGYRLHMCVPKMIDTHDGLWIVAKADKSLIVLQRDESGLAYPDYIRLFNGIVMPNKPFRVHGDGEKDTDMINLTRIAWDIFKCTGHCFNLKFINDAIVSQEASWHYWMSCKTLILVTDDMDKAALIMPLRD